MRRSPRTSRHHRSPLKKLTLFLCFTARSQEAEFLEIELRDRIFLVRQFVMAHGKGNVEVRGYAAGEQACPLQLFETWQIAQLFEAEMVEKQRVYGETYPLDEDFLEALAIMPQASGIALGFDRLVMLATGALRIDQVIWAPVAETHLG